MREHYDFSGGVRSEYPGKVDTTDVRRIRPQKLTHRSRTADMEDQAPETPRRSTARKLVKSR